MNLPDPRGGETVPRGGELPPSPPPQCSPVVPITTDQCGHCRILRFISLLFSLTTSINFLVTVHEYVGSLQTFSTGDMDQLLLNCRLEEATVSVDPTVNKILEVVMAANRTRAQRDLG